LKIDNALFSVIGVLPKGFRFPPDVELWVPADREGESPSRTSHNYDYLLKDAAVVPLQKSITGQACPALLVLLGG